MEKWKKQAVSLLTALTVEESPSPAVCTYRPSKLSVSGREAERLPVASPEAVGLSSGRLCRLLEAFENEPRANVRALYIVRDGRVVLRCARPGYDVYTRYLSHSMAKSVTGLMIGMLVDEGRLSLTDTVVSHFPEHAYRDRRFATVTVEHLLTMSSGVSFAEAGVVTEEHWLQAFFDSPLQFTPGEAFAYNSMNSYVLARMAERVSGRAFEELVTERLFTPLGIDNALWERNAEGYAKGGFGLYVSAAAWARLGQLVLDRGTVNGRRLISERWIDAACETHKITPTSLGDFNYGYHVWVSRDSDEVLFNGMLGQNVWIYPRERLVCVLLCGNSELFQQSPALSVLRSTLSALPAHEAGSLTDRLRLRRACESFFSERVQVHPKRPLPRLFSLLKKQSREPFDTAWEPVLTTFRFGKNNGALLPLFVRLMQNNYDEDGIRSLAFFREGDGLRMRMTVGRSVYTLPVGLYRYESCTVDVRGEPYLVRTLGEAVTDADGHVFYKIECVFPELPNTRMLYLYPTEDGCVRLDLREAPDHKLLSSFGQSFLTSDERPSRAFQLLERAFGEDFLAERASGVFNLSLRGIDVEHAGVDEFLLSCERERAERVAKYGLLIGLVRRFVGEEVSAPTVVRTPLGGVARDARDEDPTEDTPKMI